VAENISKFWQHQQLIARVDQPIPPAQRVRARAFKLKLATERDRGQIRQSASISRVPQVAKAGTTVDGPLGLWPYKLGYRANLPVTDVDDRNKETVPVKFTQDMEVQTKSTTLGLIDEADCVERVLLGEGPGQRCHDDG
jgi:hypothetical protein